MNVHIPNLEHITNKIGGGNTFTKNFIKFISPHKLVDLAKCDVVFIVGSSTVTKEQWRDIKASGKKIVLRLDGVPEDWRNRGTGVSKLKDMLAEATGVICQSDFTYNYTLPIVLYGVPAKDDRKFAIIYNGIDKSIFKPPVIDKPAEHTYLHVHFRKDPNKRFEEVMEAMRYMWVTKEKGKPYSFTIAGRVPTVYREHNFGLFNGEPLEYVGIINDPGELAAVMRKHRTMIYPAFADPAPNTVLEALHCGMRIMNANEYGGVIELIEAYKSGYDFDMKKCVDEYIKFFKTINE